jgi:putative peptidoglycan lipid II flippase
MSTPLSNAERPDIKKSITIAAAIMMASVLISRIMGLVREQVLSGYCGTSAEMNAYVASFIIPEILNHFLAGGFLSITFIPIFQKYLISGEREKSWRVFSNLLTSGTVALSVLVALSMVFTRQFVGILGHGVPTDLTVRLTRIIMPAQLLFYWGAFLLAIQYANNRFFLPALLPLCYNAGIILGGIVLYPMIGVEGFAWGVLAGAFVGNILLQIPGAMAVGVRYRFMMDFKDPDLYRYVLLTLPLILGLGMTFSNEVFFRFFGSFLSGGALSSINYSLRTMMIFVGVFGQAAGVASYPFLSRLAAESNFSEMNGILNGLVRRIGAFLIPCCGALIPLSSQIIAVLYQHGRFDASSTAATAPVLAVYLVGAFPFAASTIVMRSFYAEQKMIFPMVVSSAVALASIPCYLWLSAALGAMGIAAASSIAMTTQFFVLYWTWEKRHSFRASFVDTIVSLCKTAAIAAGVAALSFGVKVMLAPRIGTHTFVQNLLLASCAALPALGAAAAALQFLGVADLRRLTTRLAKRI